jgi:hypothetical protein
MIASLQSARHDLEEIILIYAELPYIIWAAKE